MARLNGQQFADKWARRLKGSTQDIRDGIARVTESPGVAAVRAQARMKQALNAAIDDGTWAAQTGAVSVEDWKQAATKKGVDRIAAGVDGSQAYMGQVGERLLAAVDASVQEANRTPRGSLEDNITRMTAFVRGM